MYRIYRSFVVALCLGLVSAAARAQDAPIPRALSLDAALRLAAERNPRVAAAASTVAAAEGTRLDASLRPNPAVTYETEGYPLFVSPRPPFLDNQGLTLRIDQEIETAGRRRLRTEAADTGVSTARALLADERRRLDFEVRRAYFQVVLAKANLEVATTTLADIDRTLAVNQARLAEGAIAGVELRRLRSERLRFADDVFSAQLDAQNAKSALLALLNEPDLSLDIDVTESLAPTDGVAAAPPRAIALAQANDVRPDLVAARQMLRQADTETRLQRALRTPNVTVGGGYYREYGTNAVVFGVTVPLPIFNRNQGGVAHANAERRRAEALTTATAIAVHLDVQQALNAITISAARVQYIQRESLDNARQARDTVMASYRLGAANLIDFLDAQRSFRDTERTYNQAMYDYRVSLSQLTAATGTASTEGQ
jgi:cobalt-zinc-cadmium efflux system outer membrane protein